MALTAEYIRCRAFLRLGRHDDATRSLADALDLLRNGDLEADEEMVAEALLVSTEVFAATGDTPLASRLDAVRRRMMEGRPRYPDVEHAHDDWLATNGVPVTTGAADADPQVALDVIRDWLRGRGARVE